jgi:hypothetical protein
MVRRRRRSACRAASSRDGLRAAPGGGARRRSGNVRPVVYCAGPVRRATHVNGRRCGHDHVIERSIGLGSRCVVGYVLLRATGARGRRRPDRGAGRAKSRRWARLGRRRYGVRASRRRGRLSGRNREATRAWPRGVVLDRFAGCGFARRGVRAIAVLPRRVGAASAAERRHAAGIGWVIGNAPGATSLAVPAFRPSRIRFCERVQRPRHRAA